MSTRDQRISEFLQTQPRAEESAELLCEDHNGTFALPFPCRWNAGAWKNERTGVLIEASVVGWRAWR